MRGETVCRDVGQLEDIQGLMYSNFWTLSILERICTHSAHSSIHACHSLFTMLEHVPYIFRINNYIVI